MRVAVTGAAGRIGRVVRPGLAELGHDIVGIDLVDAPGINHVDVRDTTALAPLLQGCDAVVHLASIAEETTFEVALDTHLRVTYSVLEAMLCAGVPRIVYASSNHAVGFTPRETMADVATRLRPDSFYGVGKAACETLCSLYVDRHGINAACLRIGSFRDRPRSRRELSTWLSHGDAVWLVEACLTAPGLEFAVVYGVSANTRGWWDLAPARALGYRPHDDAEAYAAAVLATEETEADRIEGRHIGGPFAAFGTSKETDR
jgi:uronate dehydrogenase